MSSPVQPKVRNTKRQLLLHWQKLHAYEQTTKELAAELHATQDSFGMPKAKVKALEKSWSYVQLQGTSINVENGRMQPLLHRKCYLIR